MVNLCLDIGNTRTKLGYFKDSVLIKVDTFMEDLSVNLIAEYAKQAPFDHMIISSVRILNQEILKELSKSYSVIVVNTNMTLPIKIAYETPETLGIDRICGAIGAQFLFPNQPTLSIDAGTCITYDFVDQNGIYHGGAISPGIQMRLDAMHKFTGKLPQQNFSAIPVTIGTTTASSMQLGVGKAAVFEIEGFIRHFSQAHQGLKVILTGGNTGYFEQQIENTIFAAQNLVLIGLDRIVAYTMKNE